MLRDQEFKGSRMEGMGPKGWGGRHMPTRGVSQETCGLTLICAQTLLDVICNFFLCLNSQNEVLYIE